MVRRHLSLATYFPRLPTAVSDPPRSIAPTDILGPEHTGPSSQSASTRASFHYRLGSVPSPPPRPRRAREHSHSPTSPRRARVSERGGGPFVREKDRRRREGEGGGSEMNVFRLAGDMTHLLSVVVLLLKIHTIKSCAGISLKTQELYALVFAARYLDLFAHFVSLYNTVMKLVFLASSFSIVWYMKRHKIVRRTYDKDHDTFRHYVLVLPCLLLALLVNEKFTFREVMWAFSIYLEAVAIFPQLVLLQRTRNIDNLTGQYVFFLGAYRVLYILNWIYRYFTEPHFVHWISWVAGIVQTLLYADFFYYYIMSWKNNVKLELPA